jgi:hypothetical protein
MRSKEADFWNVGPMVEMPHFLEDMEHGFKFFGVPIGHMTIKYCSHGKRKHTWNIVGLESLNLDNWLKRLTPQEREAFGLSCDAELVATDESGLHEVERRFQQRYRALKRERGDLEMDNITIRRLLGRLAKGLMDVPFAERLSSFGAEMWINQNKIRSIIGAECQDELFEVLAADLGVLVGDGKGYFKFADQETFNYYTTVW